MEQLKEELKEQIKAEMKKEQEESERQQKIDKLIEAIALLEDQLKNPEKYGVYEDWQRKTIQDKIDSYKQQLAELEGAP